MASLQQQVQLADLSVYVYDKQRFANNEAPTGYRWIDGVASGPFAAAAYKNLETGKIEIAYRGTDELADATGADKAILTGGWDDQFKQSVAFTAGIVSEFGRENILVTGHSLGGAMGQINSQIFGLDGATIDSGAASRIVLNPEFTDLALEYTGTTVGLEMPSSFVNYVVTGSLVSGATGEHLGQVQYLPSLSYSFTDTMITMGMALVPGLNLVAIARDQFEFKHPSDQVAQALHMVAEATALDEQNLGGLFPEGYTLAPATVPVKTDPEDPSSPTEDEEVYNRVLVMDGSGNVTAILNFTGSSIDNRQLQVLSPDGQSEYMGVMASRDSFVIANRDESSSTDAAGVKINTIIYRDSNGNILDATITQTSADGKTKTITRDQNGDGTLESTETVTTNSDGTLINTTTRRGLDGSVNSTETITIDRNSVVTYQVREFNSSGDLKTETVTTTSADGQFATTVSYSNGNDQPDSIVNTDAVGVKLSGTTYLYDESGDLATRTTTTYNYWEQPLLETTYGADGVKTKEITTTYTPYGILSRIAGSVFGTDGTKQSYITEYNPDGTENKGSSILTHKEDADVAGALNKTADFLSLISAIRSGEPLPIISSGMRVSRDVIDMANGNASFLNGPIAIAGAASSILNLSNAIEEGDGLGMAYAGAQLVGYTAQAFSAVTSGAVSQIASDVAAEVFGEVVPVLGIVTSLVNGDFVGAGVGAVVLMMSLMAIPGGQIIAAVYAIANLVMGLFEETPPQWGEGSFTWNADNSLGTNIAGESGGSERVATQLGSTKQIMEYLVEQAQLANPAMPVGIIPGRMPSLSFRDGQYTLHDLDPVTGAMRDRHYNFEGRRNDVPVGDPEYFQDLREAMVRNSLDRNALTPKYEEDTVRMKLDAGDPKASLTEVQTAAQDGRLAPAATGDSQRFRPIALDLDGDNKITELSGADSGVAFDVDDSGFLKQTGWLGEGEGFLVLDRNLNDQIDAGSELFSNSLLADEIKGVPGLRFWDANYDGRISADDPVFQYLQVWQDANNNGRVDFNESKRLTDLGITELNYSMNTFTRDGETRLMASADLSADTYGTKVNVVENGLIIETTDNEISLIVTATQDLSFIKPGADGVVTLEDVVTQILPDTLLANDKLPAGARIVSVGDAKYGTVRMFDNGVIEFTPEANYSGNEAGFSYIVQLEDGTQGSAPVLIAVRPVNDLPTATVQDDPDGAIYGWNYTYIAGDSEYTYSVTTSGTSVPEGATQVSAIYTPWVETVNTIEYLGLDEFGSPYYGPVIIGYDQYEMPIYKTHTVNHDTVVGSYKSDAGQVNVSDVDNPTGPFTFAIADKPKYGNAYLDADGKFRYESKTGVEGAETIYHPTGVNDPVHTDAFTVKVRDPDGGETVTTVDVTHYGEVPVADTGGGGKKPIALDLNNDGLSFTDVNDSDVFSDLDNDGWREQVSWLKKGDGFLAFDADGNGKIESGKELSFVSYAPGAQTDLEGLRGFDSNGDGLLSRLDQRWSKFGIWVDANQNGVTDPGEFRTLDVMGVESISLQSDGQFQQLDGNTIHGTTTVTFTDGHTVRASDVTLATSNRIIIPGPDGTSTVETKSPFAPSGQTFEGTTDDDLMMGTTGNTILRGGAGDDFIYDDVGIDWVYGEDGKDVIYSGADNDMVDGGADSDIIYSGLGNDLVFGDTGNDMIYTEGGNDVVFAGAGDDFVATGTGNDMVDGREGDDTIYGEQGYDALLGGTGDDKLYGGADEDLLYGQDGNDLLFGDEGADTMHGGTGNDSYYVDESGDQLIEKAGEGTDAVFSSIDYTLGDNLENLTLLGSDNLNATGNDLNNIVVGNAGDNALSGGAGYDLLDGGTGADLMQGGLGDDVYYLDNAGDQVVEQNGAGTDIVVSSIDYTLTANVENLRMTGGAVQGTGNELDNGIMANDNGALLSGLAGNDTLIGAVGNDTLDGGTGADLMSGGLGGDTYIVDNAGDSVVEQADEGIDSVFSSIDYTLTANVENLTLTGSAVAGTGNELENRMVANDNGDFLYGMAGNDTLIGAAGSDVLDGGAGSDTLDGGTGADLMQGGLGDDSYTVDNAGDRVVEQAGEGTDTVLSSIDYTLTANVDNLTLTGSAVRGTGNDLNNQIVANVNAAFLSGMAGDDTLIGGAGDDALDGGTGADLMQGGVGGDAYIVDDTGDLVSEQSNEGIDSVSSSIDYTLTANVENLTLTGSAVAGTGNGLDNRIVANDNGNLLSGMAGNDTLTGGAGDDALDGGTGADLMQGGLGDDSYIVDNTGDLVVEQVDAGIDTVFSNIDYTLTADVENLTLIGSAVAGTGNELDNRIVANDNGDLLSGMAGNDTLIGAAGNDALDGGTGADLMQGELGDDSYIVDDTGDLVVEQVNGGFDTVSSSIDYTLTANVENLTLTGSAVAGTGNELDNLIVANDNGNFLSGMAGNDTLIGGAGSDVLDGGAGDDALDGGTGADVMQGGLGNDSYLVDNAGDLVEEQVNAGIDTVFSGIDYTLTANVENLTLTGVAVTGRGNELDNVITANDNGNMLYGYAGNDTLIGGAGDDILSAGDGNNVINGGSGDNKIFAGRGDNVINGGDGRDWIYVVDGINRINANWPTNGGSNLINAGAGDAGDINEYISGSNGSRTNPSDWPENRGTNLINSGAGDDTVYLGKGDDLVDGGEGSDAINAGEGNNVIRGGKGNDYLEAGQGDDLYQFVRGDGQDVIYDQGGEDTLRLEEVNADQLWFRQSGRDLEISVVGTDDSITVENWYANHTIQRIEASDGRVLLDSQVNALVSAMAAFTPPAAGQTSLPQPLQDQLQPLLAANWH